MLFKILSNVIIDTNLVVALNRKYFELNRRFSKHYKNFVNTTSHSKTLKHELFESCNLINLLPFEVLGRQF